MAEKAGSPRLGLRSAERTRAEPRRRMARKPETTEAWSKSDAVGREYPALEQRERQRDAAGVCALWVDQDQVLTSHGQGRGHRDAGRADERRRDQVRPIRLRQRDPRSTARGRAD